MFLLSVSSLSRIRVAKKQLKFNQTYSFHTLHPLPERSVKTFSSIFKIRRYYMSHVHVRFRTSHGLLFLQEASYLMGVAYNLHHSCMALRVSKHYTEYIKEALLAEREGEFDQAISLYEEAIKQNPIEEKPF